jgi:hypothetical protein
LKEGIKQAALQQRFDLAVRLAVAVVLERPESVWNELSKRLWAHSTLAVSCDAMGTTQKQLLKPVTVCQPQTFLPAFGHVKCTGNHQTTEAFPQRR